VSVISQINYGPLIFAVNVEQLPNVKSIKDLIAFAGQSWQAQRRHLRRRLGGAPGAGLLHIVTGVNLVHVPYNGSAADVLALTRGDSHAAVDAWGTLKNPVDQGKVRTIALTTAERFPLTPDIPGMRESGVDNFDLGSTQGLAVPAGTRATSSTNSMPPPSPHPDAVGEGVLHQGGQRRQGQHSRGIRGAGAPRRGRVQRVIREAKITIE